MCGGGLCKVLDFETSKSGFMLCLSLNIVICNIFVINNYN